MFDAFGGDRWWPLNSLVVVLRVSPEQVVEGLDPTGGSTRGRYRDLDTAVEDRAPYPVSRQDTTFVIGAADGSSAVMLSESPSTQSVGNTIAFMAGRLCCDAVGVKWQPRHRSGLASAGFEDYRYAPPPPPGPGPRTTDALSLQVSDQGRRWVFDRIPPGPAHPSRPYEEPDVYRARITAERLPLELLRRYLTAVGIPVDDQRYLSGPVLTVSRNTRIPADRTWNTMAELRSAAGYPDGGVPTDLRIAASSDEGEPR